MLRRKCDGSENLLGTNNDSKTISPPTTVKAVPRLVFDLKALKSFFDQDKAPWRFVRGNKVHVVRYGFGDASKAGFGSTIQVKGGISFRYGTWTEQGNEASSNFRELENLAQTLEDEIKNNRLAGTEVFLFTDNAVLRNRHFIEVHLQVSGYLKSS